MPLAELPEPPEDVGRAGREAWEAVGGNLARLGVLEAAYIPLLIAFARAVDASEKAWAELEGKPFTRQGRGGGKHPAFQVWRDSVATARSLAEHLGASPVGMARLGLAQVRGVSLAQELIARKERKDAGRAR